jgi:hypothetical protein
MERSEVLELPTLPYRSGQRLNAAGRGRHAQWVMGLTVERLRLVGISRVNINDIPSLIL